MSMTTVTTMWCDVAGCGASLDVPDFANLGDARLAAARDHDWTWLTPSPKYPNGADRCASCSAADPRHIHLYRGDCPIYGCTWPTPITGRLAEPVQTLSLIWCGGIYIAPVGGTIPPAGEAPGPAWIYKGLSHDPHTSRA